MTVVNNIVLQFLTQHGLECDHEGIAILRDARFPERLLKSKVNVGDIVIALDPEDGYWTLAQIKEINTCTEKQRLANRVLVQVHPDQHSDYLKLLQAMVSQHGHGRSVTVNLDLAEEEEA